MLVVDFHAGFLADALGAVSPAMSADKSRVMLSAVHFEMEAGEQARIWATDSYRLHSVDICTTEADAFMQRNGSVILGREQVKTLAAFVKSALKNPQKRESAIGFTVDDSGAFVTVSTFGASVDLPLLSGESPKCAHILAMADNPPEVPAVFNGDYMADLFKSAQIFAGKNEGVTLSSVHGSKPARVEAGKGPHRFAGVLMPQRQPKR